MEGMSKIGIYEAIHEAEFRKQVLDNNGIEATVINEKDSSFLLGDIELWVANENTMVALELLKEYESEEISSLLAVDENSSELNEFPAEEVFDEELIVEPEKNE